MDGYIIAHKPNEQKHISKNKEGAICAPSKYTSKKKKKEDFKHFVILQNPISFSKTY